jgi:DNA polymerase-3 subunit beta
MSNNFYVIAQTKDLQRSVSLLGSIIERKNVIPILGNFKLESIENMLKITATDMSLAVEQEIGVQVKSHDKITISSQVFGDIIKKINDDEVHLEVIGDMLQVRTLNCKFSLPIIPASQFPNIDEIVSKGEIDIPAKKLLQILEHTKFSMSNEETRYNLNGIFLNLKCDEGLLTAVSTDGHRLSISSVQVNHDNNDFSLILPKKTVNEIAKIFKDSIFAENNIRITLASNKIRFACDKLVVTSKLIDATYPDYNVFIPLDNLNILTINSKVFGNALDRVDIMTMEKLRAIKISISNKYIEIQSHSDSKGEGRERIILGEQDNSYGHYEGEQITIGFNPKYLLDIFSSIQEDEITIQLKDGLSPTLIKIKSNPLCSFIVMPIRV